MSRLAGALRYPAIAVVIVMGLLLVMAEAEDRAARQEQVQQ